MVSCCQQNQQLILVLHTCPIRFATCNGHGYPFLNKTLQWDGIAILMQTKVQI
jgi:hypothetical protein